VCVLGVRFRLLFRPLDRRLDTLVGFIAHFGDRALVDAASAQIRLQPLDGIALLGCFLVFFGTVALRITHEVAHPTVDLHLDECRSAAVACTADSLASGFVDGDGVVGVDTDAGHVEPVSTVGAIPDVGDAVFRHTDRPVVVLDDEHHRQVVDGSEVQRLEERPLIDRALAEEGDPDAVGVALFGGQSGPCGRRTSLRDDAATRSSRRDRTGACGRCGAVTVSSSRRW
jgi:hypothetical protein